MAGNSFESEPVVGGKGGVDPIFGDPELLKKGDGFERIILANKFFVVFGVNGFLGFDDRLFLG